MMLRNTLASLSRAMSAIRITPTLPSTNVPIFVSSQCSVRSIYTKQLNKYKSKYVRPDNKKITCRWLVMPNGNFIRKKSGTKPKHGKHVQGWKKQRARRLVLANPSQRRLLRRLVPHYKTTRMAYAGVDVYREWGHLVEPLA